MKETKTRHGSLLNYYQRQLNGFTKLSIVNGMCNLNIQAIFNFEIHCVKHKHSFDSLIFIRCWKGLAKRMSMLDQRSTLKAFIKIFRLFYLPITWRKIIKLCCYDLMLRLHWKVAYGQKYKIIFLGKWTLGGV